MINRALPLTAILATGLGMGIAGDQLLRTPAGPGLNFFLLFLGLAISIGIVSRSGGERMSGEGWMWIGVGLLCGAALLWRGSELLRIGTFLAACTAFTFPAFDAGRAWIRRAGVAEVIEAMVGAGAYSALGSLRLLGGENWEDVGSETSRGAAHGMARTVVGGVLLALVPLVVFGALFISADEVFATLVGNFVRIDVKAFAGHLAGIAALSWLACGYLVGVSSGTRLDAVRRLQPVRPEMGVGQVATALGLVDLLFLAFVTVQFRYLFGGGAWVEVTPGLTYAAYARAGFFELVAAVGLAIPWLLVTHALLGDRGSKARNVFRGFATAQILLLLVIVASAIQRMLVYQDAYGLTEDRVVGTAVLVWLTVLVLWFGVTVLTGRRDRFAFGALVTAFGLVGALQALNPAGMVARHNLDRMEELGGVDAEYLGSLGSDAAPVLLARFDELPAEAQCVVAGGLVRRWGPDRPGDWKSFNWSEARARDEVGMELASLRASSSGDGCG